MSKIAIDVQTTQGQKTGFGFYVSNLTRELLKIDKKNKYVLLRPDSQQDFSAPQRWWWDQVTVPAKARSQKVDLLHQPAFSAPVRYAGKTVVTVHDIIAVLFGKDIPFFSRQFFAHWMPYSYRYANKIICVSEHTKKDLVKYLHIDESKIVVIPEAAGEEYQPVRDKKKIAQVLNKYKIGKPFILHIGTLNPRKNLSFLIDVFSKVRQTLPDIQLVITGKKGWYYENLFELVEKLGLQKDVIFTGYIEDCEAPVLYSAATVYAFPSLYEGFGLPPLEAMACGTPVVASNMSSIPEVMGNAGILLSPTDKIGWVSALQNVLSSQAEQKKLSDKSLARAKNFSWRQTAQKTIRIYEELLK